MLLVHSCSIELHKNQTCVMTFFDTHGRLQDFVHEATQIDKLTNSEQNRHLQTINSKINQITKSHNHYNFNIKQIQPKFYQRTYHQSGDDS